MKIETLDAGRVRIPKGELVKRVRKGLSFRGGTQWHPGFWFDHDDRNLPVAGTEADKCTARDLWMNPKHLLAWFGEHRTGCRFYAFGHAPTEPETAVCIEIAAVTHAMPDRARWRGNSKFQVPNSR